MRAALRLRGKFILATGFVLLLAAVLLALLGLPQFDAATSAWTLLHHFDGLSIESHETLELQETPAPIDIGIATLHIDMPVGDNLYESSALSSFGIWWEDGTRLSLSNWYRPKRYEFRSATTQGHIPADELLTFAAGPRPSFWNLLFAGRESIAWWGDTARELINQTFPPSSGSLRVLETSEGVALVACAKDDYVGMPERAYSLRGRWWAADGSISFAFTYSWPEDQEPLERDACLEKADDLVSRIRRPQPDTQPAPEEPKPA